MNETYDAGAAGDDEARRPARTAGAEAGWHTPVPREHPAAPLLTAEAVRSRCAAVTEFVGSGESALFTWHPDRIAAVADYVAATIKQRYRKLDVPYHSRWRHFESGVPGELVDRWAILC